MIVDAQRVVTVEAGKPLSMQQKAISAFVGFIEKKLGALVVRPILSIADEQPELQEPLAIAALLQEKGVLRGSVSRLKNFCDEPQTRLWGATANNKQVHQTGGSSSTSDADAARAAIAEAPERYLWTEATDHFRSPTIATETEIAKKGAYTPIEDFAGLSKQDRKANKILTLSDDSKYLWTAAESLVSGKTVYIPVQLVSAHAESQIHSGTKEPTIRIAVTTGLATWPTKEGARLRGALEVIERDAYMIFWLNQLILPRISVAQLCEKDPALATLVEKCRRYGITVHATRMVTDAPAYAICVILEDTTAVEPRFTLGLKAGKSLQRLVEGGIHEALRSRRSHRHYKEGGNVWDMSTETKDIGHRDRLYYWSVPEHAKKLEFMLSGPLLENTQEPWDTDTDTQFLARIVEWCKKVSYDFLAVSLGASKLNPTPWAIEVVVIPQMQPTYLHDNQPQAAGPRLTSVPKKMGYEPLHEPHLATPHPFS